MKEVPSKSSKKIYSEQNKNAWEILKIGKLKKTIIFLILKIFE